MELELKLALPVQEPLLLQKQLARSPLIGRRKPKRQQLHNTYYDTPEHALQRSAVALRVRQIGDAGHPQWVQTLKVGAASDSAFSRRGEWEVPNATGTLDSAMLADTPWMDLDPDGTLYPSLLPVFTTTFERLSWVIKLGDTTVEVALDIGSVQMDGHRTPLCELEIELLSGSPDALFEAARQIGKQVGLMPLHLSKAERAYRLAGGTLDAPLRARPPALTAAMAFGDVVQAVLREAFLQFTANLYTLRSSEAPEVLHQARVGWRRFKSAVTLFKLRRKHCGLPGMDTLRPLLDQMALVRDLDVAATEVLPAQAGAFRTLHPRQAAQWSRLESQLAHTIANERSTLRQMLFDPALGRCLLDITRWIELHSLQVHMPGKKPHPPVAFWGKKRLTKLAAQLTVQALDATDPQTQHALRILSKRLRYGVESLRPLLPPKPAARWYRSATRMQTRVGRQRDQRQALDTALRLHASRGVVAHLRAALPAEADTSSLI